MEFIIKISQFLLSLSLLIILHELGHFIPAKLFKTKVEKFFLFFDIKKALVKKKIGETVYGIGWLPLGGYVKIAGMIDESMDKEQMAQPPKPWEFRSKPAWQRLIIMLGGVFVNFVLALLIYIAMSFAYGDSDISTNSIKDGYWISNPLLQDLGFKTGDDIIAINDYPVSNFSDLKKYLIEAESFTINRNGVEQKITLPEDFLGQLTTSNDRSLFELRVPFMVGRVSDSSLNKGFGLKRGDIISTINGKEVKYFDQFENELSLYKNQTIRTSILRKGEVLEKELKVDDNGKHGGRRQEPTGAEGSLDSGRTPPGPGPLGNGSRSPLPPGADRRSCPDLTLGLVQPGPWIGFRGLQGRDREDNPKNPPGSPDRVHHGTLGSAGHRPGSDAGSGNPGRSFSACPRDPSVSGRPLLDRRISHIRHDQGGTWSHRRGEEWNHRGVNEAHPTPDRPDLPSVRLGQSPPGFHRAGGSLLRGAGQGVRLRQQSPGPVRLGFRVRRGVEQRLLGTILRPIEPLGPHHRRPNGGHPGNRCLPPGPGRHPGRCPLGDPHCLLSPRHRPQRNPGGAEDLPPGHGKRHPANRLRGGEQYGHRRGIAIRLTTGRVGELY